jgi:photosystem II stability/assembly factor-like uncharacterized protein
VAWAEPHGDAWRQGEALGDHVVHCLAADPHAPGRVYAGTRGGGVWRSDDCGRAWRPAGLDGQIVKALAASRAEPGALFAGTMPPALYVSRDGGGVWTEVDAFRRIPSRWWWRSPAEPSLTPYIQALAPSPVDPAVIVVGIEAGAVVRTADGGRTWSDHRPGALRDCHSAAFHASQGEWVYEAGGTGAGAAFSRDAGQTWQQPRDGLDRRYGWACAADPARPDVWYVSASPLFTWQRPGPPAAHVDGAANAYIFRSMAGGPWQKLAGGLPQPLMHMAYALVTDPAAPGVLYAGLSNGQVWRSDDHGDAWQRLPFEFQRLHALVLV